MENTLFLDTEEGTISVESGEIKEVIKTKKKDILTVGYLFLLISCTLLVLAQLFLVALFTMVVGHIGIGILYWVRLTKGMEMDISTAFTMDQQSIEEECFCPSQR